MSENHPACPRRSRRAERAQHIYSSREGWPAEDGVQEQPCAAQAYTPNEPLEQTYTPNEETHDWQGYTPNKEPAPWAGYTLNEETEAWSAEPVQPDFSAYYSREASETADAAEPAFAPPPKMEQFLFDIPVEDGEYDEEEAPSASNVYRTRKASWVDAEERIDAIAESELGYQVREDAEPPRKKRHVLRTLLIVLGVLVLLGAGAWLLRDKLFELPGVAVFLSQPTEEPFTAVVTPEPIKAYDAAPAPALANQTRSAISRLSGSLEMETHIVTDSHVVTRNLRKNGTYDFYLFTAAEGRLLCYFEGLGPQDMIPLQSGGFYVAQKPYLISPNGSALIRTADLEAQLNDELILHPLYRGWAVAESLTDGSANYLNLSSQPLSTLWFSRTFPFTGEHTLAYVDTGATASAEKRYLLYVLGEDGSMSRWLSAGDMSDVVVCALGMAYLADGSLYHLPDTSAPLLTTAEAHAYLDCDAMVIRDPESGKYGLFVHGEQHYDFAYDSIRPVESELQWDTKVFSGPGGSFSLHAVAGCSYPQPLSHSFVLEKDGQREYVALSTLSSFPFRLDGEF